MTTSAVQRLELIEKHLDALRQEVGSVRHELVGASVPLQQAEPATSAPVWASPTPVVPTPIPPAAAEAPSESWREILPGRSEPADPAPEAPRRGWDLDRMFGASGLAWAGGIVTLLGIVFFFIMAASNGWVGPNLRVALGAVASIGLVGVATWLRGKLDNSSAAIAAAGAGIAGGLATVIAATRIYHFLPQFAGLSAALLVAAGGAALAMYWNAEPLAAFGLGGAALSIPMIQDGVQIGGAWFALVALAAAAALAIDRSWLIPLTVTGVCSLPQILFEVVRAHDAASIAPAVLLASATWLVLTASAAAVQLRSNEDAKLHFATMPLIATGLATALVAVLSLFDQGVPGLDPQGIAFLVLGGAYLAGAVVLRQLKLNPAIVTVLGAVGLAMEAAGLGELMGGPGRILAFAAQATALTYLAVRLGERRLRFAAAADIALAGAFALDLMHPTSFFQANGPTFVGVLAAAAVAAALGALAWWSPDEPHRQKVAIVAGLVGLYTTSMGILALVQLGQDSSLVAVNQAFQRGQMAVSILWAIIGLTTVIQGVRRASTEIRIAGVGVLVLSLAKLFLYDLSALTAMTRAVSFFLVGGALIAGAAVIGRRETPPEAEVLSTP